MPSAAWPSAANNLIKKFRLIFPSMKMVSQSAAASIPLAVAVAAKVAAICVAILATSGRPFLVFLVKTRSQQVARNVAVAVCCCGGSCQVAGANWCVSSGILNEAIKIERLHSYTFGPRAPAHHCITAPLPQHPTIHHPQDSVYLLIQSIFLTATRWHASIDHVNWNWVTWPTWHRSGICNFPHTLVIEHFPQSHLI